MSTTLFPICVVPPERHYDSCKELIDDLMWFEQSRAHFYREYSQFKPQPGLFEQVRKDGGRDSILLPTAQDYGVLYRGQGCYYDHCLPTLYRQKMTEAEHLAAEVRIAEFRLFLEQFEVTRRFEKSRYHVDFVGLAQHYGLKTDVLDVTSDIYVAMFFAMCDYDCDADAYKPKNEDKLYVGYLYVVLANENGNDPQNPFGVFSDKIEVIGLQPFKRPGRQKGFAYHAGKEGMVSGYLYSFNYTKEDSVCIFNYFRQGNALWTKDEIVDVAKVIASTTTLSSEAVRLATRMFGTMHSSKKSLKLLRNAGYTLVSRRRQPWASINKPISDPEWRDIQRTIVARKLHEGEKQYPCVSTKIIGQELLFNYLYGGVDSPKGYNSGIFYMEETGSPVFGIQTDMHHEPLRPSAVDGKIHAEWYETGHPFMRTRSFHVPGSLKPSLKRVPKSK